MQFLIRDDDACALTRPEEIERCYGDIWDEIPIGLSVTPFRVPDKPGHGMPETLSRLDEPHPLGDNSEMVSFLREQIAAGRIFVALHGYHHARVEGQPEYVGGKDLTRKTREGRSYLQDLLNCPIHTVIDGREISGVLHNTIMDCMFYNKVMCFVCHKKKSPHRSFSFLFLPRIMPYSFKINL